jgi:hypothetical protein
MVKPFSLQTPMVMAAGAPFALPAIETYLQKGQRSLRNLVTHFIMWLKSPGPGSQDPAEAQRRFSFLRLRFNAALTQFDIFADALVQRSEHENGVWLAGLDAFASDALLIHGGYFQPPPLLCYLDRGGGAAIRRARTRLPGGGKNPVAIIRVPRERMVGSGIASSLVHEVGHQAAALLGLVESLRPLLKGMQKGAGPSSTAWTLFDRWISEIVADLWAVGRVGIGATFGLMGVVSLPRAFVFRMNFDDPHPMPWLRVKLSCAMGKTLYPDPQWDVLAQTWETLYPRPQAEPSSASLSAIEAIIPSFVELLTHHRPQSLRGSSLAEILITHATKPPQLRHQWQQWRSSPGTMFITPPSLAFATINQAKADGRLTPEQEGPMVGQLLRSWALARTRQSAMECAPVARNGQAVGIA